MKKITLLSAVLVAGMATAQVQVPMNMEIRKAEFKSIEMTAEVTMEEWNAEYVAKQQKAAAADYAAHDYYFTEGMMHFGYTPQFYGLMSSFIAVPYLDSVVWTNYYGPTSWYMQHNDALVAENSETYVTAYGIDGQYYLPYTTDHTLTQGGQTYNIKAGDMFTIPPYIETYYEADNTNPWSYIWIGFTTTKDITEILSDVIKCSEAEKIFSSMKNCESFSNGRSAYLSARLWDLFALLSEGENNKYDHIEKAVEFIHSNYMHDITVEKIAQHLNLDRTYFSVIFKKRTGLSPKQYLLNYRMSIAATLIIKKHIAISVVANSVGYSDLYTFSKMFKRHFGISPSNYSTRE